MKPFPCSDKFFIPRKLLTPSSNFFFHRRRGKIWIVQNRFLLMGINRGFTWKALQILKEQWRHTDAPEKKFSNKFWYTKRVSGFLFPLHLYLIWMNWWKDVETFIFNIKISQFAFHFQVLEFPLSQFFHSPQFRVCYPWDRKKNGIGKASRMNCGTVIEQFAACSRTSARPCSFNCTSIEIAEWQMRERVSLC